MTYPPSYGHVPYVQAPRPKRRGIKRTVFGALGLLANAVGLVVMPVVAAMIAAVLMMSSNTALTPLDPAGDSFRATTFSLYTIAVPQEDLGSTTCEIEGTDIDVTAGSSEISSGNVDGVAYYDLYDVQAFGDQEVTVTCEGGEAVALWDVGMGGILVSLGIGVALPVLLGLVALVMTIWGIIALVRSA
jgi:hypothetical protein